MAEIFDDRVPEFQEPLSSAPSGLEQTDERRTPPPRIGPGVSTGAVGKALDENDRWDDLDDEGYAVPCPEGTGAALLANPSEVHNPEFDTARQDAHDFVTSLGMSPAPLENIAIVTRQQAAELSQVLGGSEGGYQYETNSAYIVEEPDSVGPITTRALNDCTTVHEIAHSGSANQNYDFYLNEALAGCAEYLRLRQFEADGSFEPAEDYVVRLGEIEVSVPGSMRYLDAREAPRAVDDAYTSNGLLAALGMGYALSLIDVDAPGLLAMSSRGGVRQFEVMKRALDALGPGLADVVGSISEKSGLEALLVTSMIQKIVRTQGLDLVPRIF